MAINPLVKGKFRQSVAGREKTVPKKRPALLSSQKKGRDKPKKRDKKPKKKARPPYLTSVKRR
jgi:hypothetical protein